MKNLNKSPFKAAEIEIVSIIEDVITASQDPFPGEEDDFTSYYWDRN